jgi:hypothetical protein
MTDARGAALQQLRRQPATSRRPEREAGTQALLEERFGQRRHRA